MTHHPTWNMLNPKLKHTGLGLIPTMLDSDDNRTAKEQLQKKYGKDWNELIGYKRVGSTFDIRYPGEPILHASAITQLHNEIIVFYHDGIIAIWQLDGTFEVARLD